MKPPKFAYFSPDSVDDAISLIASHGEDARYIAGGQSLVPMMNLRVAGPPALIDLNGIPELSFVETDENGALRIGAMTRIRRIETDPVIADANPLLATAAAHVAHTQIRNRGTIGGSISHADPAAEMPGVVLACDAELSLRGISGRRIVKAEDFFSGVFSTALADGELIEEIRLPLWPDRRRWGFQEIARRDGDFALAGIAAWFDLDVSGAISSCGLAAIGAGDTPLRLHQAERELLGAAPSATLFADAAECVGMDIEPFDDIHASAEYRREIAAVLTKRVLTEAWERDR